MKKAFQAHRAQGEEGMALLFALGFLALLLILGLGFVTTSLLSQKIAANNGSRAQARMFARSAAARALLDVMLYNDQALLRGTTVKNYDGIYSYDQVAYNDDGTTNTGALNDQLRPGADTVDSDGNLEKPSKLEYRLYGKDRMGKDCKANWVYFYDAPANTAGRRIIGRVAFQALPRQEGRLSLYAVTGGSKLDTDYRIYPHDATGSKHFRWGRDISELNLMNTTALRNWYTSTTPAPTAGTIPFKYRMLYNSYHSFFPSTDSDDVKNNKKRWIEYWFTEGRNTLLGEAFPVLESGRTVYYNRFNISDFYYDDAGRTNIANGTADNWYDRFRKTGSRTEGWTGTVDALKNTADALDWLVGDAADKAVAYDETLPDDVEANPSGLPFLKRVGSEKWSFETLADLRRQIAANFNDYCDKDNIPTSDKPASEWSVSDSAKFPAYTGNERTLYINEVALKLGDIKFNFTYGDMTQALPTGTKVEIGSIKPTLIAELVNMYDPSYGEARDQELLDPANFELETGLTKLSFDLELRVLFKYSYEYKLVDNSNPALVSTGHLAEDLDADVDYDPVNCARAKVDFTGSATNTVANFGTLTGGYSTGSAGLSEITLTGADSQQPDPEIFAKSIQNAMNANLPLHNTGNQTAQFVRYTKIEVVKIGCRFKTDGRVAFAPLLLKAKGTVADDVKDKGVDFVRMDRTGEMTIKGSAATITPEEVNSTSGHTLKEVCFLGGFEARDPRQNLNPRYSASVTSTAKSSDWSLYPQFAIVSDVNPTVPSMTFEAPSASPSVYDISGGAKNRYSNPAAPKYADCSASTDDGVSVDSGTYDKETAEDPAWLGIGQADSDHPVAQHVSTAYIRNAPMVSPWEIGLIHRGREWQTLNIRRAGGLAGADKILIADIKSKYDDWDAVGTDYRNGDGAILEFIKVGINCRCMGKIPLEQLRTNVISAGNTDWNGVKEEYNKEIIKMLFDGIRAGQTMKQFYAEAQFNEAAVHGDDPITTPDSVIADFIAEIDRLHTNEEFLMRSQFLNSKYGDKDDAFTFQMADTNNDAGREELIGKTVNLLTVGSTQPNVFRVIVVAQSIRDVGGIDNANPVPITKIHNGAKKDLDCLLGRFDFVSDSANWENNTYFDEITGEVKALVTIERIPATNYLGEKNEDCGRLVITGIEFIE